MRQLMAGVYSLLPLGVRVRSKVMAIIREELDAIGGQEFLLPELHPREIWERTGRAEIMKDILFSFEDARGASVLLGPTHEEIFATLAAELTSYRQLPQLWYQVQTKFRDEQRPKSGLLRVREFTMKDSYSFDVTWDGLDLQFDAHEKAYMNVFRRLGMSAVPVAASSGAMGGKESVEFMVASPAGEDDVAHCKNCGYAANVEKATSLVAPIDDEAGPVEPERFATPGVKTIQDLVEFDAGAPADRQIKTLVYVLDGAPVLVLVRGDHELIEQKLVDGTGATDLHPAHNDEIRELLGADAGSLGAVGLGDVRVIADPALQGRSNMVTGANVDDFHLRGVDVGRDIGVSEWMDVRLVHAGEPCPQCGEPLEVFRAIEVGHIFKLGDRFARDLGATVLGADGDEVPLIMGSYGIGVERNMAAAVEANHDEKGIVWPVSIAPYEVAVVPVKTDDPATVETAEDIYEGLLAAGVDTIIDDRDTRPGVKFNDVELIGIPYRVTVGPRGLESGSVEVYERRADSTRDLAVEDAVADVVATVLSARSAQ